MCNFYTYPTRCKKYDKWTELYEYSVSLSSEEIGIRIIMTLIPNN